MRGGVGGQVVKASTARAVDLGSNPRFSRWVVSRSSPTSDLKIGATVATLPGTYQRWDWLACCQYTLCGWDSRFHLPLLSQFSAQICP